MPSSRLQAGIWALAFLCADAGLAGNLLFNSGFELGDKGWSAARRTILKDGVLEWSSEAAVVDSSVSKSGANSMKLVNKEGTVLRFCSHDFPLEPKARHVLSFWAKAANGGAKMAVSVVSVQTVGEAVDWSGGPVLKVEAGPEWKRYELKFSLDKPGHDCGFVMFQMDFKDSGTVWIDDVQLEKGDAASDWKAASEIEAAVYVAPLLEAPAPITGTLTAISYKGERRGLDASLTMSSQFDGAVEERLPLKIDLPDGKAVSVKFAMPKAQLGAFKIASALQPEKELFKEAAFFARVEQASEETLLKRTLSSLGLGRDKDDGFKIGFSSSMDGIACAYSNDTRIAFCDRAGSPEEWAEALRLSGANVVRNMSEGAFLNWREIEPEPGRFDFVRADQAMADAERRGVKVIATISDSVMSPSSLPAWLRKRDRLGHEDGSVLAHPKFKAILPPLEDWTLYLSTVAKRYKGRIYGYEIMNEPNLYLTPEYYMEYLKAASLAIKEADPNAKVIGVCATEDFGAAGANFMNRCLELGAADLCDAISFHPYNARMDDTKTSAMELDRRIRAMVERKRPGTPVWNSELFYFLPNPQKFYKHEENYRADAITRRLAIDMGEGVAGATPMELCHLFWSPYFERSSYTDFFLKGIPSTKFAAYASACRRLRGAEPFKTIEKTNGLLSYVYTKDGETWSVMWAVRQDIAAELKAPKGESFDVFDLFGNKQASAVAERKFALNRSPVFLKWSCEPEEAARAVDAMKTEFDGGILAGTIKVVRSGSGDFASVAMTNEATKKRGKTSASISSEGFEEQPAAVEIESMEPFETKVATFPVKLKKSWGRGDVETAFSFDGKTEKAKREVRARRAIAVTEGAWSPWQQIGRQVAGKVDSPADLKAAFRISRDKEGMLLEVEVADDVKGERAANAYEEDCVELFIDLEPLQESNARRFAEYTDKCWHLAIAPRRGKDERVTILEGPKSGLSATAEVEESGAASYLLKSKLSFKDASALKLIGFDLAVDDSDATARKSQTTWQGDANLYKDRREFGLFELR